MSSHINMPGCSCSACVSATTTQIANQNVVYVNNHFHQAVSTTAAGNTICSCGSTNCNHCIGSILTQSLSGYYQCTCNTVVGGSSSCPVHSSGLLWGGGASISLGGSLFPSYAPLTPEETKELAALETQRSQETKQLKLEAFKELPCALRQHVIDSLLWYNKCKEISTMTAIKSIRQEELELKKPHNFIQYSSVHYGSITPPPMLIDGLSYEEMIQAHNDATMEESLEESDPNL
jgi:hypothetical protein